MESKEFWTWFDDFAAPRLREWPKTPRDMTFRKMFRHLDSFDRPVRIIETGCVESPDNWAGNGCSTILFNKYVETHPESFALSLELDVEKVIAARDICRNVEFLVGDSVEGLKRVVDAKFKIDLLYLDASDHNWTAETPTQVHHFNELMAIMPSLREDSMVAIDDSMFLLDDYPQYKVMGKGGLIADYAMSIGAELQFCEYQIGFTKMTGPILDVQSIDQVLLRARSLAEAGQMIAADRLYRLLMYLTQPPIKNGRQMIARGEACANFGLNAHRSKKFGMAADWFHWALDADPGFVEYRCCLARSMVAQGAYTAARREAAIATDIEPDNPVTWQTLGGIEADLLDAAGTIRAYDKQLETAKATGNQVAISDALLNRGVIALDTTDNVGARALAREILDLGERPGDAWFLMAMIEYRISNHEKSIEYFQKAIALGVRNAPLCHWNYSLPLQAIGRLRESWEEHVWGEKEETLYALYVPHHRLAVPKWRGNEPTTTNGRKTIVHVHVEAGFGDNIAVWRYFPLMVAMGYEVHYETSLSMLSLVSRNFPQVKCIERSKDYPGAMGIGLKDLDYHVPIGDVAHAFKTDIDTIPWSGPYIKADPELSAKYAKKLVHIKDRRIGLCWSSGIRKTISIWLERFGRMKSMQFIDMAPILNTDLKANFVSLQVGEERIKPQYYAHVGSVFDVLPEDPSWDDTAALIDNLDLVITVDTGVAHLAGAMGKPCWVMMQRDGASWHFMCWRPGAVWNEASPWYPSIRIFRQHEFNRPGYWKDVVEDVARALDH